MSKILFSKHQKPSEGRAQLQSGFMWAFVILQGITGGICIFVSGPSLKNYRVWRRSVDEECLARRNDN